MKTNMPASNHNRTHEGGMAAASIKPVAELERTVLNCLLFEDTFYEKGSEIADRMALLCTLVEPKDVARLAVKAKDMGLRHVPLFLAVQLAVVGQGALVGQTICEVIRRADELSEFLSLYWKEKRCPLSAQVKKGLAAAFGKFNEYQFGKYNRDNAIKLRDVLFMCHAKPSDGHRGFTGKFRKELKASGANEPTLGPSAALYRKIVDGTLETPDTWEVALSAGQDKKATFERLILDGKLGGLALLRNLRNMNEAGVDHEIVTNALSNAKMRGVLPFQFFGGLDHAPMFARGIETAMLRALDGRPRLLGKTALLIDVSGSMYQDKLSAKSQRTRIDAALALAIVLSETADVRIWTFSNSLVEIPALRGFGLAHATHASQQHGGTQLRGAIQALHAGGIKVDRFIVITDEQSQDGDMSGVGALAPKSYIVNVAPYKPGLELAGGWSRINGFSERIVDWMLAYEEQRYAENGSLL